MKIAVIGTGYVGLVQGVIFADAGNDVVCMDIDEQKIALLNKGEVPIFEPGLRELLVRNASAGRLHFTTDLQTAIKKAKLIFLCLPTPQGNDGSADLRNVLKVAKQIAQLVAAECILVSKGTVPVGTSDKLKAILRKYGKRNVEVVSNPEFLKEGAAIQDSLKPDRIVIGTRSKKAAEIMKDLYAPFVRTGNPIILMDERSAELTKYAANAFLATKISFMNELANLCEQTGADIDLVRKGIGSDPRIGSQFLFSGVGYGGSCFPKDVKALIKTSEDHDAEFRILKSVDAVNERQKRVLLTKISKHFGGSPKGKVIAVWGLAFKPQTDDMREAPSIPIILGLIEKGAKVRAHDPVAMPRAKTIFHQKIEYVDNAYEALKGADALVVITEWNEFRRPDLAQIKSLMKKPVIFDGRNIYDPKEMKELGFRYYGIGRRTE